mgnify:CR=1 FL=1
MLQMLLVSKTAQMLRFSLSQQNIHLFSNVSHKQDKSNGHIYFFITVRHAIILIIEGKHFKKYLITY